MLTKLVRIACPSPRYITSTWFNNIGNGHTMETQEKEALTYHKIFDSMQLDSEADFIFELQHQSQEDQDLTLQVMILAAIIDGKYHSRGYKERSIVNASQKAAARTPNVKQIRRIAHHFAIGEGFYFEDLVLCTGAGGKPGDPCCRSGKGKLHDPLKSL